MLKKNKVIVIDHRDFRFATRSRKESYSLAENGYNVYWLGPGTANKIKIHLENKVTFIQLPSKLNGTTSFLLKFIRVLMLNLKIVNYLMKNKFDVYHIHDLKIFLSIVLVVNNRKKILIYDAHEIHSEKRNNNKIKNKILNNFDYIFEKFCIKKFNLIIQASKKRSEYFANRFNIIEPLTIENFDRIPNLNQDIKIHSIRELGKIKPYQKIIIFTGHISFYNNKKLENVLKSLNYMSNNIVLCLIGFINKKEQLTLNSLIRDYNLAGRVHYLGHVDSNYVISTISSADIAIIPLYANNVNTRFSALNKLSQSVLAGLPIVCSNYEDLSEIIYENPIGQIGHTFDVEDPKSIANAVALCVEENTNRKFGANSIKLGQTFMNWTTQEEKLLSAYINLCSQI